ncbi:MAG: folylpolyglutamate synthase/dihydrofolate synthase family protein [Eubacteriales bacterium]|nr:folylpolyglutamate synthase/dihydrofolate synthase family protein [Eubacteriales bacterium]
MNYQQSRAYIKDAEQYGSVLGLANMQELLNRLGNPQNDSRYIHIAGTNGKGSVIAYLYTVLSEAGYHVGRYISPTIYSYRERLEAAGRKVSREKFAEYVTEISRAVEEMTEEGLSHPTPFEIETAAAFLFFKEEQCDVVLLEVGMGGDMDATNIISSPLLAVLVSISLDHQAFLGNTLEEIAEKKAGIIKSGCETVTMAQAPEVLRVIEEKCKKENVPLYIADGKKAEVLQADCFGQTFCYEGENYEISLAGAYQTENAALALKALALLEKNRLCTSLAQRKKGLKDTIWGGRFTVIQDAPLFVVDGAHNPGAAQMLSVSIERYFNGKNIYYIMGMFRDKDYRSVIRMTHAYARKILAVQTPGNPRALPAKELAAAVREYHADVEAMDSLSSAVDRALALAGLEDVILAFGSLSFIGELTEIVKKKREEENHD